MPVFLFTDIEGSTNLWKDYSTSMNDIIKKHDKVITEIIEKHNGKVIKYMGDGIFAVFKNGDPLNCVLEIQKKIADINWKPLSEFKIRIALNRGEAEERDGDYFGHPVSITSRILDTGWGGQILLTKEVLDDCKMPEGAELVDFHLQVLKDLGEPVHIFGLIHPELPYKDFPPLKTLNIQPKNFPTYSTRFIGRDTEVENLTRILKDSSDRLITILGMGGIGKTRLACEVASEIVGNFKDGTYFVPLAPVESPIQIITSIGKSLEFPFEGSIEPGTQLANYLREKEMILILDNLEHLVEETGIIEDILSNTTDVKILATSREKLYLVDERVFQLKGLAIPEDVDDENFENYDAINLFVEGATRVNPNFKLSEKEKPVILKICQKIQGIPLAIELASAWARVLDLEEILDEIEVSIDSIKSKRDDIPERHRSIRAMFEYSWNLFSKEEKKVARKLSVFRGGFKRKEAQKIADASPSQLSALMDKSLIRRNRAGRFEIHELLREFLQEKLNEHKEEKKDTEDKHSSYFADFMANNEENLKSDKQLKTLKAIEEGIENIVRGWNNTLKVRNNKNLKKYINSIFLYYDMTSHYHEGLEIFENAFNRLNSNNKDLNNVEEETAKLLANIYIRYSWLIFHSINKNPDEKTLEDSIDILKRNDMKLELALAYNFVGVSLKNSGDYEKAIEYYKKSSKLYSDIGDIYGQAIVLSNEGLCMKELGEYIKSRDLFLECFELFKKSGSQTGKANTLVNLGGIYVGLSEFKKATDMLEESLALHKEINDKRGIAACYTNLGGLYYYLKDIPRAINMNEKSIAIKREIGNPQSLALTIGNLGFTLFEVKNYEKSLRLFKECYKISEEIGNKRLMTFALGGLGYASKAIGDLEKSEEYFKNSLKISREYGMKDKTINTLIGLSDLSSITDNFDKALNYLKEALDLVVPLKIESSILELLTIFARILIKKNNLERAVKILFLIVNHPQSTKSTKDTAEDLLEDCKKQIPEEKFKELFTKAKSLKLDVVVEELLKEL